MHDPAIDTYFQQGLHQGKGTAYPAACLPITCHVVVVVDLDAPGTKHVLTLGVMVLPGTASRWIPLSKSSTATTASRLFPKRSVPDTLMSDLGVNIGTALTGTAGSWS